MTDSTPRVEQSAGLTVAEYEGRVVGEKLAGFWAALREAGMDDDWQWTLVEETCAYLWGCGEMPDAYEE